MRITLLGAIAVVLTAIVLYALWTKFKDASGDEGAAQ